MILRQDLVGANPRAVLSSNPNITSQSFIFRDCLVAVVICAVPGNTQRNTFDLVWCFGIVEVVSEGIVQNF